MCAFCVISFGLGVAAVVLLLWYVGLINDATRTIFWNGLKLPKEGFEACGCKERNTQMGVINPFVWPYSGASCVDDYYILGKNNVPSIQPLTHLNTPDHVELV